LIEYWSVFFSHIEYQCVEGFWLVGHELPESFHVEVDDEAEQHEHLGREWVELKRLFVDEPLDLATALLVLSPELRAHMLLVDDFCMFEQLISFCIGGLVHRAIKLQLSP
jgi:hypothetical protein